MTHYCTPHYNHPTQLLHATHTHLARPPQGHTNARHGAGAHRIHTHTHTHTRAHTHQAADH